MKQSQSLILSSMFLLSLLTLSNTFDYTDTVAYENCFNSYLDGELCNDRLVACNADAQCNAA